MAKWDLQGLKTTLPSWEHRSVLSGKTRDLL